MNAEPIDLALCSRQRHEKHLENVHGASVMARWVTWSSVVAMVIVVCTALFGWVILQSEWVFVLLGGAAAGLIVLVVSALFVRTYTKKVYLQYSRVVSDLNAELGRQRQNELLIRAIGEATRTYPQEETLLESVAAAMDKHLRFEQGAIFLCDQNSDRCRCMGAFGQMDVLGARSGDVDSKVISQLLTMVRERGELVIIEYGHAASESAACQEIQDSMGSMICAPITEDDEVMGMVAVAPGDADQRLTPDDQSVVMGVATQVGVGLSSLRSLRRLQESERHYREVELQLTHSQKLEALGRLAGGVAHDFNNLLMGIQGNSSLMLTELGDDDPHKELAREIDEYVRRASDLTAQLLAFGRGGKFEAKPIVINDVVGATSNMFARTKKELEVRVDLTPDLWPVEADARQMEQMVLKLCLNAWQSMPGGGQLKVRSENVKMKERSCEDFTIPAGCYVHLSVIDSGVGMDQETQRRIFEPFFSTRKMGRGQGLGLASVYGIVKNHGGFILIESEVDQGSTFHVYLPTSNRTPVERKSKSVKSARGSETVLFVDDERMILRAGQRLLTKLGYQVLCANSGEDAIKIFKSTPEIGVVVLDMVMPGMSGAETFGHLRRLDPEVKVLLSSGYSADGQAQALLDNGCDAFLQKPYDIGLLSDTLREVLKQRAA